MISIWKKLPHYHLLWADWLLIYETLAIAILLPIVPSQTVVPLQQRFIQIRRLRVKHWLQSLTTLPLLKVRRRILVTQLQVGHTVQSMANAFSR